MYEANFLLHCFEVENTNRCNKLFCEQSYRSIHRMNQFVCTKFAGITRGPISMLLDVSQTFIGSNSSQFLHLLFLSLSLSLSLSLLHTINTFSYRVIVIPVLIVCCLVLHLSLFSITSIFSSSSTCVCACVCVCT